MRRIIRTDQPEQGAVAFLVAIIFGTGSLLACAALTLDVGNINLDRRQLQNGADAAALSAARDCAENVCPSADPAGPLLAQTNYTRLTTLANGNAGPDGATQLARVDSGVAPGAVDPKAVCGTFPGLPACATVTSPSNLQECPSSSLDPSVPYVRVYTQTLNQARTQTVLPYSFGAALAGTAAGADQQACAAVAVGAPDQGSSLPFAFSACEWNSATSGGTIYPPSPPYGPANPIQPSWEKVIAFNTINGVGCNWGGHDFPGGFGWLCHGSQCTPPTSQPCSVTTTDDWVDADTGVGAGNDCATELEDSVGTVIHIPVFDCVNPNKNFCPAPLGVDRTTGTHSFYHLQGYAAFYLTAIDVGSIKKSLPGFPSPASEAACTSQGKCLYGWFLRDLDPSSNGVINPAAHGFGLSVIQVVG